MGFFFGSPLLGRGALRPSESEDERREVSKFFLADTTNRRFPW